MTTFEWVLAKLLATTQPYAVPWDKPVLVEVKPRVLVASHRHTALLGLKYRLMAWGWGEPVLLQEGVPLIWEVYQEHQPDLIITTDNLVGITGLPTYEHIRQDDRFRHVPIIVLTHEPDPGLAKKILGFRRCYPVDRHDWPGLKERIERIEQGW